MVWKLYLSRQYGEAESESRKLTAWNANFTGGYVLASVSYKQDVKGKPSLSYRRVLRNRTEASWS